MNKKGFIREATIQGYVYIITESKTGKSQCITLISEDNYYKVYVPKEVLIGNNKFIEVKGVLSKLTVDENQRLLQCIHVFYKEKTHEIRFLKVKGRHHVVERGENILLH